MSFVGIRNVLQQLPSSFFAVRHLQATANAKPIPSPRGSIQNVSHFLTAIGRSAETKLKVMEWEELWRMRGPDMKQAGVGVEDRRYILWAMEKYRQGQDPSDIAHEQRPPKKIRGWGPSVQHGKRIRSRRHR